LNLTQQDFLFLTGNTAKRKRCFQGNFALKAYHEIILQAAATMADLGDGVRFLVDKPRELRG